MCTYQHAQEHEGGVHGMLRLESVYLCVCLCVYVCVYGRHTKEHEGGAHAPLRLLHALHLPPAQAGQSYILHTFMYSVVSSSYTCVYFSSSSYILVPHEQQFVQNILLLCMSRALSLSIYLLSIYLSIYLALSLAIFLCVCVCARISLSLPPILSLSFPSSLPSSLPPSLSSSLPPSIPNCSTHAALRVLR